MRIIKKEIIVNHDITGKVLKDVGYLMLVECSHDECDELEWLISTRNIVTKYIDKCTQHFVYNQNYTTQYSGIKEELQRMNDRAEKLDVQIGDIIVGEDGIERRVSARKICEQGVIKYIVTKDNTESEVK